MLEADEIEVYIQEIEKEKEEEAEKKKQKKWDRTIDVHSPNARFRS